MYCIVLYLVAHVGVLVGGDLGAVREVHVLALHERAVDVLLVDVLDHGLKIFDVAHKNILITRNK